LIGTAPSPAYGQGAFLLRLDDAAVMRELSMRLSEADIDAIASYFEKR